MQVERREFPRINIRCKAHIIFGERVLVFDSHTLNLSNAGMRVALEEKLHVTTPVALELFLADGAKPLQCKGEVVWVKERAAAGQKAPLFDTGIKFVEISSADQEQINRLVDAWLAHRKAS